MPTLIRVTAGQEYILAGEVAQQMCDVWEHLDPDLLVVMEMRKQLRMSDGDEFGLSDSLSTEDWSLLDGIWAKAGLPAFRFGMPWDGYDRAFARSAERPAWDLGVTLFPPGRRRDAMSTLLSAMSKDQRLPPYSSSGVLSGKWQPNSMVRVRDARSWLARWDFDLKELAPSHEGQPVPQPLSVADTQEQRQEKRYRMCVDAGLKMPTNDYARLPRGIGEVAKREGIKRQSFAADVKAHIRRLGGR